MVGGGMQGPRMVRDVFRLAKENAPAIIFIDEIDAIATARFDAQTGADREVQRILMELLNQMDGFDQTVNVKVRTRRPPSVRVKADEETAYLLKLSPDHRARRRVSEHELVVERHGGLLCVRIVGDFGRSLTRPFRDARRFDSTNCSRSRELRTCVAKVWGVCPSFKGHFPSRFAFAACSSVNVVSLSLPRCR
jgi:hypothetical protein